MNIWTTVYYENKTAEADRDRQAGLQWARRHVRLNRADCAGVLFTDESRFNLYKNDGLVECYFSSEERRRV